MTIRLFYESPYLMECESEIVETLKKDDKMIVVLDKTPFYPEGGGQPSDTGRIGEAKVSYVYEEEDIIYHVVDLIPESKKVKCVVDFDRRFDHMQQHSGEHLLSGAFFKLYKAVNCGFHMGEDYVTIDMDLKEITEEMLKAVEQEVNDYIYRNEEVMTYNMPKEEALKLPLRKEIKVEGSIRIVQIGNKDYSACCGTHVLRSGEIGIVKITKAEKYKGMTRIYFKCGKRAVEDYANKQYIVQNLVKFFAVEESGILDKVEAQAAAIKDLNRMINEYKRNFALQDAEELLNSSGSKVIKRIYEGKNYEYIQLISEYLDKKPGIFVLGSVEDKRIIVGHNGDFNVNIGKLFKENLASFKGRGGGNDKKAQAAFASAEDMANYADLITEKIQELKM